MTRNPSPSQSLTTIAYFTGVRPGESGGHHCYVPGYEDAGRDSVRSPWALGGGMTRRYPLGDGEPTDAVLKGRSLRAGEPRFAQQDGWTLMSMWDYSADRRPGSHASFAFGATLTDAEALVEARRLFPEVIARIEAYIGRELTP